MHPKDYTHPHPIGHKYDDSGNYGLYELGQEVSCDLHGYVDTGGTDLTFHIGDWVEYDRQGSVGWISQLRDVGSPGNARLVFTTTNPWRAPEGHYTHGSFITNPSLVKVLASNYKPVTEEEMEEVLRSIASSSKTER